MEPLEVDDGKEEVAAIIPESDIGYESKGIAFASVAHYLRNLRRLHRNPPPHPLAVVIPGSTITIAKMIGKVVEREGRDGSDGKQCPESGED